MILTKLICEVNVSLHVFPYLSVNTIICTKSIALHIGFNCSQAHILLVYIFYYETLPLTGSYMQIGSATISTCVINDWSWRLPSSCEFGITVHSLLRKRWRKLYKTGTIAFTVLCEYIKESRLSIHGSNDNWQFLYIDSTVSTRCKDNILK